MPYAPTPPAPTTCLTLLPRRRAIRSNVFLPARFRWDEPRPAPTTDCTTIPSTSSGKKTFPLLSLSRRPHRNGVLILSEPPPQTLPPHRVAPLTGRCRIVATTRFRAFAPDGALSKCWRILLPSFRPCRGVAETLPQTANEISPLPGRCQNIAFCTVDKQTTTRIIGIAVSLYTR